MMINSIKLNSTPNGRFKAAKNVQNAQKNLNFTPTPPLSYSLYGQSGVSFRGDVPVHNWDKADKLFNEYKQSLDSGDNKLKVMDMLEASDLEPDEAVRFMQNITGDRETAFAFIDEVTRDEDGTINPSKSPKIVNTLLEKFGNVRNFNKWYTGRNSYTQAFEAYTEEYYKNAKSIEELYAWLPNWDPNTVREKYKKLTGLQWTPAPEGGFMWADGYTVGKLPEDFGNIEGDKEKYRAVVAQLVKNISKYDYVQGTAAKDSTNIDVLEGLEQYGFKSARLINAGLSPKHKVILDDKYIIKIDRQKDHNAERDFYNYLNDIRQDTAFVNGQINNYIGLYWPGRTPEHYFYDDYTGTNVYQFLPEDTLHFIENNEAEAIAQCSMLKEDFSDLHRIGVYYRDFNPENFIQTENGLKCVDSGKCVYFDLLKPDLNGCVITMPAKTESGTIELSDKIKAAKSMKDWN